MTAQSQITVDGHLYVHVAACPCPEMQAEVERLALCRRASDMTCLTHSSFWSLTEMRCEFMREDDPTVTHEWPTTDG